MDCHCKTNSSHCRYLHDIEQPNIDQTEAAIHTTTTQIKNTKPAKGTKCNTADSCDQDSMQYVEIFL